MARTKRSIEENAEKRKWNEVGGRGGVVYNCDFHRGGGGRGGGQHNLPKYIIFFFMTIGC